MSSSPVPVIILGAGAAGLAAGKYLKANGIKSLILEARSRLGGRCLTVQGEEVPLELGAEFIHGSCTVLNAIVESTNLTVTPVMRFDEHTMWWSPNSEKSAALPIHSLPEKDKNQYKKLKELYRKMFSIDFKEDISVGDYFKSCGCTKEELEIAEILFGQTNCCPIETLSVHDIQNESKVDHALYGETRINEGYHELFTRYASGLDILYNQEVSLVEWNPINGVSVTTSKGKKYHGKKIIITVSIGVLKAKHIEFRPPLPERKINSINSFQMHPSVKIEFVFNKLFWDPELTNLYHTGIIPRFWTHCYHRDTSIHVLSSHVTSEYAARLDNMTREEVKNAGLKQISLLLKVPEETLRKHLKSFHYASWQAMKYSMGGYATPYVGKSHERLVLAEPTNNTIFWAGEATAYHSNPQTVHGAIESGWRVVHDVLTSTPQHKL